MGPVDGLSHGLCRALVVGCGLAQVVEHVRRTVGDFVHRAAGRLLAVQIGFHVDPATAVAGLSVQVVEPGIGRYPFRHLARARHTADHNEAKSVEVPEPQRFQQRLARQLMMLAAEIGERSLGGRDDC